MPTIPSVIAAVAVSICTSIAVGQPYLNPNNGHWYEVVGAGASGIHWTEAAIAASSRVLDGKPGRLATFTSNEEMVAAHDNLGGFPVLWNGGFQDKTIGAYSEPGGGWSWMNGESMSFAPWFPGNPDNINGPGGDDRILQISTLWQDAQGDFYNANGYIVEYAEVPVYGPIMQSPVNGHYYQSVTLSCNWWQAKALAESRSHLGIAGHLVTITSPTENDFVRDTFGTGGVVPVLWYGGAQGTQRLYEWITGECFVYTAWTPGAPSNGCPNELPNGCDAMIGANDGLWQTPHSLFYQANGLVIEFDTPPVGPCLPAAWVPGVGTPGTNYQVNSLAVLPSGDVIVGGDFSTAGGVAANHIAGYHPTTGVWSSLGSGTDNAVWALAVLPGGDVLVGGFFSGAGGVAANRIVRYNPITGVWSALGSGINNGSVNALAVLPGGDVIVSGGFFTAGGVAANRIARYNPITGVWSALGSGINNGSVNALAVLPGGDVIVSGDFFTAGGVAANRIVRYNPTTRVWSSPGSGPDSSVWALAVLPGGDVIVSGDFFTAGGVVAPGIARYNPITGVWSSLGSGTNGSVFSLAVLPGGDVIVGGAFTFAGGVAANQIARYNPRAGVWSALGTGTNNTVFATVVQPGGDVLVGGNFTSAGCVAANNIARYFQGTPPPSIVSNPITTGCIAGIATFTITASGAGPLTYQWRRGSTPINPLTNPSAATASLVLTNIGPADFANYDCIVTDACGSVTSNTATLTSQHAAPQAIITAAIGFNNGTIATIVPGSTITIQATSLTALSYQWLKDGIPLANGPSSSGSILSGATTQFLSISNVTFADRGEYVCVVGDSLCGTLSSNPVALSQAAITSGSLGSAGFPDLVIVPPVPVGGRRGTGSGSTGGGFASATIEMLPDGGGTTLSVIGTSSHDRDLGFTAVGTVNPVVFSLPTAHQFRVVNTSTAVAGSTTVPVVPVTLYPISGSVSGNAQQEGVLSPGSYGVRFGVASLAQDESSILNPPYNEWYGSFVETGLRSTSVNWRLELTPLPPVCPADLNQDGTLDPDDLADFIGAYFSVPPASVSDFNADGATDPDDLADFIGAFFTGCD